MALLRPSLGSRRSNCGLPVRVLLDGVEGRLDHREAQVPPAALGDPARAVRHAALVDGRPQPGIADELAGRGEAGDVADGRQDGDRPDQADAGQLDQERDALVLHGRLGQVLLHQAFLALGEEEGVQVGLDADLLGGRDRQQQPPGCDVLGKQVQANRGLDVVAVQHRVQAVLHRHECGARSCAAWSITWAMRSPANRPETRRPIPVPLGQ